jgi:hypothetical protein
MSPTFVGHPCPWCDIRFVTEQEMIAHQQLAHPVRHVKDTHPALVRSGLPEPLLSALTALAANDDRITPLLKGGILTLTTPSPGRMTMAYSLANELIGHIQLIGTLIEELRRFHGEGDGAYQARTRKEIDYGTLKPVPKRKSPSTAKIRSNLAKARKKTDRPGRNNPYSTPCEEGDD